MANSRILHSLVQVLRTLTVWALLVIFVLGGLGAGLLGIARVAPGTPAMVSLVADLPMLGAGNKTPEDKVAGPDWRNLGRVTVLILGVDRRDDEGSEDPVRTDTMMLATIDPGGRSAGMIGIPRDLLVPIAMSTKECNYLPWGSPYGQDRVNTAYVYGQLCEFNSSSGTGGPGLAKETVQYNFGVRVHYYALIDFDGFSKLIDAMDGVDVVLESPLTDNYYPTPNYGTMRIHIPAGPQHLDGEKALWFVRSRHMDSDFGRIQRQQQLLMAVRDKLLRLDMVPRYPQLLQLLSETVRTDMTLNQMLALTLAAREVPSEHIVARPLEYPLVTEITGTDGAALLLPNRELIRGAIGEVFSDVRLKDEAASIEILNGTSAPGLAKAMADRLKDRGFGTITIGNATDGQTRSRTEIHDFAGKAYTANQLAGALGVNADRITSSRTAQTSAGDLPDIRIILGDDLKPR